jgi:hypothetical protein
MSILSLYVKLENKSKLYLETEYHRMDPCVKPCTYSVPYISCFTWNYIYVYLSMWKRKLASSSEGQGVALWQAVCTHSFIF